MATLANIQIADKSSTFDSGAAYLLTQTCDIDRIVAISADREVEVNNGSPYVVARIKGATDATKAFDESHEVVQQALDFLSAQGGANLTTRNTQDECFIWWRGPAGQVLRYVSVLSMSVTVGLVNLVVTDKAGNVVPPTPQPNAVYHEGLRYFRISQVTDDLFDAFRNMYLAFESLLESILPYNGGGEGVWLRYALIAADNRFSLAGVFKPTTANVVGEIYNQLYVDIRCAIFHAKGGSHLVPQKLSDRKKVAEGLRKLARLVMFLAERLLQVRFPTGGVTYEGFNLMAKSLFQASTIYISESDIPINKTVDVENPAYKGALAMQTRPAPELSEPGLQFILGSIGSSELCQFTKISRFGIKNNDKVLTDSTIEAELNFSGLDVLEAQLGVQLRNVREPKRLYNV